MGNLIRCFLLLVVLPEDKIYLHCPTKIREHLTQPEYVALCEQAYPTMMEQMLLEEQRERLFRRKRKSDE